MPSERSSRNTAFTAGIAPLTKKQIDYLRPEAVMDLLRELHELDQAERKRKWETYKPLPQQLRFHKSQAQTRVFCGGNRAGKTTALIVELIWYAQGRHPYRTILAPNHLWMVCLDSEVLEDVILPKLWEYLPESEVKRWNVVKKILELKNGTVVKFKSCDSGAEKFQSAECRAIFFDEEPPEKVWKECRVRVGSDHPLDLIMAMTPLKGMDWTYEELVEKQSPGKIEVFGASMLDNHHIPYEERLRLKEEWQGTPEESARLYGGYFHRSGLIYRGLDPNVHLIDSFKVPDEWPVIRAVDPHPRKPSAAVWASIAPDGTYYITDELNDPNETLFEDFVARIKEIDGKRRVIRSLIDPSSLQRNAITGDSIQQHLSRLGLGTSLANNDLKVGYDRVRKRLVGPHPKLLFFKTCPKTWWQMTHLVYDEWKGTGSRDPKETQRKLNDDLADCVRYICAEDITYYDKQMEDELVRIQRPHEGSLTGYL